MKLVGSMVGGGGASKGGMKGARSRVKERGKQGEGTGPRGRRDCKRWGCVLISHASIHGMEGEET